MRSVILWLLHSQQETDYVSVRLDDGGTEIFYRQKYAVYEYATEDGGLKRRVLRQYRQFPICPAYAMTVHKSQGQTYDYVNHTPNCKSSGQLYVALSRVKDISHLYLDHRIQGFNLVLDKSVLDFYDRIEHPEKYPLEPESEPADAVQPVSDGKDGEEPQTQESKPQPAIKVAQSTKLAGKVRKVASPKGGRPARFPHGSKSVRVPNEIRKLLGDAINVMYPPLGDGTMDTAKIEKLQQCLRDIINS